MVVDHRTGFDAVCFLVFKNEVLNQARFGSSNDSY